MLSKMVRGMYIDTLHSGIGIKDPRTQSIINGCLTMWNMGFAFWGAYVIDKFGRRKMMLTSLTGQLLCGFVPWTICNALYTTDDNIGAGHAVIAFIFIGSAFYATTWNGILTGYTVEIMSYDIRSKLIVSQNLLVQASITGFNYLNPVALEKITWKYYVVIDCVIVLAIVVVYFTYPETSKITLEEVSTIFDGKNAVRNDLLEEQIVMEASKYGAEGKDVAIEKREFVGDA